MGNLFGESINGPNLKEKLNNLIITKNKEEQIIPYNINIKNSLMMNYIEVIRNGQSLLFGINNFLIRVPNCLLAKQGIVFLNNKQIVNYNGIITNINELKMLQDSSIVSDGIEYKKENQSTKYYLVEGNIRVGYQTNNFKGNFKHIGYGNIVDSNLQNCNRLVLDAYDNYGCLVDFYVQAPYNNTGIEQKVENSLSFWWNDERNKTYTIYGDHNNVFHAAEINIRQPNQGRGIIGSHTGSEKDNAIYLRSLNLNTETGQKNYTTLEIRSPKNTDGTEVDLKERLKFQTAGDFAYRIYGEHNYKEAIVYTCSKDTNNKTKYTFKDLGIDFKPGAIVINERNMWVKNENGYYFFQEEYDTGTPTASIELNNKTNLWEITFDSQNYRQYFHIQFYG